MSESEELALKTDFSKQQFSKEQVASKVVEQYDDAKTRLFYQITMGGGGHDIHYGIFRHDTDGVRESSAASTEFMMTCMDWALPVTPESRILDLGSGHGGCAHAIVQKWGCNVECFNLCPQQNEMNRARCVELGISDRVSISLGDFNNPLPEAWRGAFDYVWSSEVLCHAGDKAELLAAVGRCLKPGGIFLFSDIMGADAADEAQLRAFTDRNATTALGRPSEYTALLGAAGMRYMSWWDNSHHLERYFRAMLAQIDSHSTEMLKAGLTEQYLNNWRSSLRERAETQAKHGVFAWGVFLARKPLLSEGNLAANGHA